MGGALALALHSAGSRIVQLVHRSSAIAEQIGPVVQAKFLPAGQLDLLERADVFIVSTADDDLELSARWLSRGLQPASVVLHTSGARGSEVFSLLATMGHETGSMHPLISISDPFAGKDSFDRSYFCLEGTAPAVEAARSIVEALGGVPFSIDTRMKPLYHAAAVMACGHLTALLDMSRELNRTAGISEELALRILLPLVESTLENIKRSGTAKALTGSFARGDIETIKSHIEMIDATGLEDVFQAYISLGKRSLQLAGESGLPPKVETDILELLHNGANDDVVE